jgi:hypothetical protein
MIIDKELQVLDRQALVGLEDSWLGCRVWHKMFCGHLTNLRVRMSYEANEL